MRTGGNEALTWFELHSEFWFLLSLSSPGEKLGKINAPHLCHNVIVYLLGAIRDGAVKSAQLGCCILVLSLNSFCIALQIGGLFFCG